MDLVRAETVVGYRLAKSELLVAKMTKPAQFEITGLQRELDELRDQIAMLEVALKEKPNYGLGKGDPSVTRWELDRAMLQRLRQRAASLQRAMSRLSQGTYGTCKRCGNPIHPDRLAVLPDTKLCVGCAQAGEQ